MQISAQPSAATFNKTQSLKAPNAQPASIGHIEAQDVYRPSSLIRFSAHPKTKELEFAIYNKRYQSDEERAALLNLKSAGADVDATITGNQETLLTRAIRKGDIEQIKLLCQDLHADPNKVDHSGGNKEGYTPLIAAVKANRPDIISLLHSLGAKPEAVNRNGQNAVTTAAGYGKVPELSQLLRLGVDVNAQDKQGFTPLIMATKKNQTQIIQLLHTAGADLQKPAKDPKTQREKLPLEVAKACEAKTGNKEARELLENLIRLDTMDESPNTSGSIFPSGRPPRRRRPQSMLSIVTHRSGGSFVPEAHVTNPFHRPGTNPFSDSSSSFQPEPHETLSVHELRRPQSITGSITSSVRVASLFPSLRGLSTPTPGSILNDRRGDTTSLFSQNTFDSGMFPSLSGLHTPIPKNAGRSATSTGSQLGQTAQEILDKFLNHQYLTEAENNSLIDRLTGEEVAQSIGSFLRAQVDAQGLSEDEVALQILQHRLEALNSINDPQQRISRFWQQVDLTFR